MAEQKKNLVRRMVRGPDGQMRLVFVDPTTGIQVNNPQGYNIIDAGNTMDLKDLGLDLSRNPFSPRAPRVDDTKTTSEVIKETAIEPRNGAEGTETGGTGMSRDPSNNFGYVDVPGFMSFANYAPGMIGMASRGINAGLNANNLGAINASRGLMGLDALGPGTTAKGVLGLDKGIEQGHVANVAIGPNTYSVGLEALDDQGRTTMTPNEARSRALSMGLGITEVDEAESAHGKGLFSGITDAIAGFVDGLFGPEDDDTISATSINEAQTSAAGFPDAPASPTSAEAAGVGGSTGTDVGGVDMAGGFGAGYGGPPGADTSGGYSGMGGADSPGEGAGGGPGGPGGAGHGPGAGDADSDY